MTVFNLRLIKHWLLQSVVEICDYLDACSHFLDGWDADEAIRRVLRRVRPTTRLSWMTCGQRRGPVASHTPPTPTRKQRSSSALPIVVKPTTTTTVSRSRIVGRRAGVGHLLMTSLTATDRRVARPHTPWSNVLLRLASLKIASSQRPTSADYRTTVTSCCRNHLHPRHWLQNLHQLLDIHCASPTRQFGHMLSSVREINAV